MPSGPRDFVARFLSDTKRFKTDDAAAELDQLGEAGDAAAKGIDGAADRIDDSFDRIAASSRRAGDDISHNLQEGGSGAGAVGSEIGAEFSENIGEGLRSGDLVGTLEETFTSLAGALGPVGIGIGVGAAVAFGIIRGLQDGKKQFQETFDTFMSNVDERTGKVKFADTFKAEVTKLGGAFTDAEQDTVKYAEGLEELERIAEASGIPLRELQRLISGQLDPALTDADENLTKFIESQASLERAGHSTITTYTEVGDSAIKYADQIGIVRDATDATAEATKRDQTAQENLTGVMDSLRTTTRNVTEETIDWKDAINDASDAALGAIGIERDYQAALDDITESIKENGNTLDLNTEKGRANSEALEALIGAHLARRDAMIEEGKSQEEVNAFLATAKTEVANLAGQMTKDQPTIDTYTNTLNGIPPTITTNVHVNTPRGAEAAELAAFNQMIAGLVKAGENPINIKARVEHTEVTTVLARTAEPYNAGRR